MRVAISGSPVSPRRTAFRSRIASRAWRCRREQLRHLLGEAVHEGEAFVLQVRFRNRLAAQLLQLGLVIEQLELAWATGHEEINHVLGLGGEMRRLWGEWVGEGRRLAGQDFII